MWRRRMLVWLWSLEETWGDVCSEGNLPALLSKDFHKNKTEGNVCSGTETSALVSVFDDFLSCGFQTWRTEWSPPGRQSRLKQNPEDCRPTAWWGRSAQYHQCTPVTTFKWSAHQVIYEMYGIILQKRTSCLIASWKITWRNIRNIFS